MKENRGQLSLFNLSTTPTRVLTVSEITAQVKDLIEEAFDDVAVVGEISNAKLYPSGHWYFSLKDKNATLSSVCFKGNSQYLKFDLEDGLMVVAYGRLSVYPPRGAYQLTVSTLEPVGIGSWQLAFEQLKEKLVQEGLLAPERKRPIPPLPRRVGVVTSPAGAALRDILTALKRRNPNVRVLISPARVQGDGSAEEIAEAIDSLQQFSDVDVIIVARGGGSIEDLWSFNTEIVARAVARSRVPVIAGVGHETDVTICDLVADLRAPTPTAAAELVARGRQELLNQWSGLNRHLVQTMEKRITTARLLLQKRDPIHVLARLEDRCRKGRLSIRHCDQRLDSLMKALLSKCTYAWHVRREKLLALDPLKVLERGFSIVRKVDGPIVRSSSEVTQGELLLVRLSRGQLKLRVEAVLEIDDKEERNA